MANRFMVVYQNEVVAAQDLAKRIGVSESCIKKRWSRGKRDADLVLPSQKGRPGMPRTFEHRFAAEEARQIREAEEAALKRRLDLRQRAREAAEKARREHAAAFAKPLIDRKLLTTTERIENEQRVKGRQRWNAGWMGESRDTRESGR